MPITLINARPSPFGRKVAVAMLEKGIEFVVRYDSPWGDGTCTPQYSPLEQLPILISADGEYVYDSTYILEWLEAKFPQPPLLPSPVDARMYARKRQLLGERLMEVAQNLIFEMHRPEPSTAWIARQTRKILGAFAEMERLEPGLVLDAIDLGDIAIGTTLLLFEFAIEAGLSPPIEALRWRGRYAKLTALVEALERRASFVRTAPAHMEVDLQATVG